MNHKKTYFCLSVCCLSDSIFNGQRASKYVTEKDSLLTICSTRNKFNIVKNNCYFMMIMAILQVSKPNIAEVK